jgi:hypothetical protein
MTLAAATHGKNIVLVGMLFGRPGAEILINISLLSSSYRIDPDHLHS